MVLQVNYSKENCAEHFLPCLTRPKVHLKTQSVFERACHVELSSCLHVYSEGHKAVHRCSHAGFFHGSMCTMLSYFFFVLDKYFKVYFLLVLNHLGRTELLIDTHVSLYCCRERSNKLSYGCCVSCTKQNNRRMHSLNGTFLSSTFTHKFKRE